MHKPMRRAAILSAVVLLLSIITAGTVFPLDNVAPDTERRLMTYALSNGYTASEAQSLLAALDSVPLRSAPPLPLLPAYIYGPGGTTDRTLTAVVNPVCSECARVLNLLIATQKSSLSSATNIRIMLLP